MISKFIAIAGLTLALGTGAAQAQNAGQKADKDSQSFINTVVQHNYAEIDVGKLAQEKGQSQAVKDFGAMLVKDHSEANDKAKQVASQIGVNPPSGADVMHKAEYLKLKILSGASFDKAFAQGMVKDHQADVKKFQQQSAKSDPTGAFAKETLPTLQKHLAEAQKLQQQTSTTGSGATGK